MANSSALTSSVHRREIEPNIKPVWEQVITFTIEAGGGASELSYTAKVNGLLLEAVIEVGAVADISGTANVDFDDNRGVEFAANASLAEGSETILSFFKPINDMIIRVDPSDDPDTGKDDWEIVITLRGI